MLTVENDWIQYEAVPARRVAVRGGASCAQRIPVVAPQVARARVAAVPPVRRPSADPRMRLTRRGRIVLAAVPVVLALSGALLATGTAAAQASDRQPQPATRIVEVGR